MSNDQFNEKHISDIVANCLRLWAAGEAFSEDHLIEAHPELMPELARELRKVRLIATATSPSEPDAHNRDANEPDSTGHATVNFSDWAIPVGALRIRCPHCRNPMGLVADTPVTDVTCSSCGSSFSLVDQGDQSSVAEPFETIGHFRLISRVGMGSFGTVWKARDTELDRTVAIKIPRKGELDAKQQEQFLREARVAAQLNHPNIVTVHEFGRHGDTVYIVSDFVRGVTLTDWLTGRRPTFRDAARLMSTVAAALHHAHEAGVVHRDLKPSNIAIDDKGDPHIMDFGLAKREAGEVTMTMEGQILGTPAYMSPEQAQGESHTSDRRADVYSLGVILFQLLTGELPFRGNTRMLIHQILHDEPPSPKKLEADLPRDLETICLKCLEKDPSSRFETADELHAELTRYLRGEPIKSRPTKHLTRIWKWCRRKPVVSGLSAILAVSLVAGTAVSAYFAIGLSQALDRESSARAEISTALDRESSARIDATRSLARETAARANAEEHLYVNSLLFAQRAIAEKQYEAAEQRLDVTPERLRDWEWRFLKRQLHNEVLSISDTGRICFSEDGQNISIASRPNKAGLSEICTWNLDKLEPIASIDLTDTLFSNVQTLRFVDSGRKLIYTDRSKRVRLIDVESGEERLLGRDVRAKTLEVSADGHRAVLFDDNFPAVDVWGLESEEQICTWQVDDITQLKIVAIGPHGHQVAMVFDGKDQGGNRIRLMRTDDAEGKNAIDVTTKGPITSHCFSPDGSQFVSIGVARQEWPEIDRHSMLIVNTDTGTRQELDVPRNPDVFMIHPNGRQFIAGFSDGTIEMWNLPDDKTSSSLVLDRVFRGHRGAVTQLQWHPSGDQFASANDDGTVKVWDMSPKPAITKINWERLGSPRCASPDLKQIAAVAKSKKTQYQLWNVTDRKQRDISIPSDTTVLAFDAINRRLALKKVDQLVLRRLAADEEVVSFSLEDLHFFQFTPDGKAAVLRRGEQDIEVRDLHTGAVISRINSPLPVSFVSVAPDGNSIATCSEMAETIDLWDLVDGRKIRQLKTSFRQIQAIHYRGDTITICGNTSGFPTQSGRVVVWNVTEKVPQIDAAFRGQFHYRLYSDDQAIVVVADRETFDFDPITEKVVQLPMEIGFPVTEFSFDADGDAWLLTEKTRESDVVSIVDVDTLEELVLGTDHNVSCLSFSNDGKRLVTAGSTRVTLWDAATGKLLFEEHHSDHSTKSVELSDDGRYIVALGRTKTLFDTRKEVQNITGSDYFESLTEQVSIVPPLTRVRFFDRANGREFDSVIVEDPDHVAKGMRAGTKLIAGGEFSPITSRSLESTSDDRATWRTEDKDTLYRHLFSNKVAAIDPTGTFLACEERISFNNEEISITRLATRELVCQFKCKSPRFAEFSSDGTRIAVLSDKIDIYDTVTGNKLGQIPQGEFVFSPDGKQLIVAARTDSRNESGVLRVYNLTTLKVEKELATEQAEGIAFSRNGQYLAALGVHPTFTFRSIDHRETISVFDNQTGAQHSFHVNYQNHDHRGRRNGQWSVHNLPRNPDKIVVANSTSDTRYTHGLKISDHGGTAINSTGTRIITLGDNIIHVANAATGEKLLEIDLAEFEQADRTVSSSAQFADRRFLYQYTARIPSHSSPIFSEMDDRLTIVGWGAIIDVDTTLPKGL